MGLGAPLGCVPCDFRLSWSGHWLTRLFPSGASVVIHLRQLRHPWQTVPKERCCLSCSRVEVLQKLCHEQRHGRCTMEAILAVHHEQLTGWCQVLPSRPMVCSYGRGSPSSSRMSLSALSTCKFTLHQASLLHDHALSCVLSWHRQ